MVNDVVFLAQSKVITSSPPPTKDQRAWADVLTHPASPLQQTWYVLRLS